MHIFWDSNIYGKKKKKPQQKSDNIGCFQVSFFGKSKVFILWNHTMCMILFTGTYEVNRLIKTNMN